MINRINKFILILITLSLIETGIFSLSVTKKQYLNQYGFAESLFQEKDYYRAMTEFQRSAFSSKEGFLKELGYLKSTESFFLGNQYKLDLISSLKIKNPILLDYKNAQFFCSYYKKNQLNLALNYLTLLKKNKKTSNLNTINYQLLLLNLKQQIIKNKFSLLSKNKALLLDYSKKMKTEKIAYFQELNQVFLTNKINELFNKKDFNYKSPILGGFLSAILPGAGQAYANKWGDGIISFLFVSFLSSVSVIGFKQDEQVFGYSFATLATIFYIGNIYGGYRATYIYNQQIKNSLIKKVDQISLNYQYYFF